MRSRVALLLLLCLASVLAWGFGERSYANRKPYKRPADDSIYWLSHGGSKQPESALIKKEQASVGSTDTATVVKKKKKKKPSLLSKKRLKGLLKKKHRKKKAHTLPITIARPKHQIEVIDYTQAIPATLQPPFRPALLPHERDLMKEKRQKMGPGNELRVVFSQDYGFDEPFVIDEEGYLDVPEIGRQKVAGMTLHQIERILKERLRVYFKEVDGLRVEVIKQDKYVRVVGAVKAPGLLSVSKTAGLSTILAKAKGIVEGADLSHILIIDLQQEKHWVDYAKYQLTGDPNDLPEVPPGSYVFIPLKAPARLVTVQGFVVKAGSYRWSPDKTLLDYISDAHGLKPSDGAGGLPNVGSVQVFRYDQSSKTFRAFYVDLVGLLEEGGRLDTMPKLLPGDSVYIPNNREYWFINPRVVYVFGQVAKPGRYRYSRRQTFLDIVVEAGGFKPDADRRDIRVVDNTSGKPSVRHFNLEDYFRVGDQASLPQLLPGYVVFVPSTNRSYLDIKDGNFVMVMGSVANPGRYEYNAQKTIMDVLIAAGGVNDQAVISNVIVINRSDKDPSRARSFDLYTYLRTGNKDLLPVLRAGDLVYVPSNLHPKARYYTGLIGSLFGLVGSLALLGG